MSDFIVILQCRFEDIQFDRLKVQVWADRRPESGWVRHRLGSVGENG